MNMVKLRGVISCVFIIASLTSAIVFFYNIGNNSIVGLVRMEDYVYYDPKQIPTLLLLPVMVLMDLSFIYLLFPFMPYKKEMVAIIEQKLMIPVTIYAIAALILGFILSMVISIYPLGNDYYKCKSTSIVSSGSHYARTKEMCKQRAYSSTTEEEQPPDAPESNGLESPAQ